ncbi:MAG TPA: YfiR family protein [Verrucomicrobiae bacterium]|nr:YfiR family protein [Verrucomicrobiae bacterium]
MVRLLVVVLATLGFPCGKMMVAANAPDVSEEQVKAAFLINFPKYVDWPANAFAETNSPIVVAVFGETSLDGDLQRMIKGKVIMGHPLVFKRVTTEEECASGCQILFIDAAAARRVPDIINKLDGASTLTVGDSEDFLDSGGVIKLAKRDRKIRLEVNLTAARRAHLKLSSKLLGVADVVLGKPQSGGG